MRSSHPGIGVRVGVIDMAFQWEPVPNRGVGFRVMAFAGAR